MYTLGYDEQEDQYGHDVGAGQETASQTVCVPVPTRHEVATYTMYCEITHKASST